MTHETTDRPAYDGRALTRERTIVTDDAIPPRVRISVTRLANGTWRPEMTLERFDADPLTPEGCRALHDGLQALRRLVEDAIASWEEGDDDGE